MKIYYKKSQLLLMLLLGLAFITIGILSVALGSGKMPLGGLGFIGLFYIGIYAYRARKHYAYYTDEYIRMNTFPVRQIHFADITEIKKIAGDYIIRAGKKEIILSSDAMDVASIVSMDTLFERLQHLKCKIQFKFASIIFHERIKAGS